ncbi:MAG: hypothetical protein LBH19_01730 [Dysgonamonadaceae bacterium]|jgi:hypothetical protein|nr:hypothetical protein [Dysgonamonadaceae bacterium]
MKQIILFAALAAMFAAPPAMQAQITLNDLQAFPLYNETGGAQRGFYVKRGTSYYLAFEYILPLDVYGYYGLKDYFGEYNEPYNTELKRRNFENSDDFADKLDYLKDVRRELLRTVFYVKGTVRSTLFDETHYDLERKAFPIGTHKWDRYGGKISKELVEGFVFNTLPVQKKTVEVREVEFFSMPIDEQTAADMENGKIESDTYVFFMLNGKMMNESWTGAVFYSDKVRIVNADRKTGKLYFDQSFPEGCLPLAKVETMSPAEYQAYKAEQERIAAEQKAEQRRAEMERIKEERRNEQERLETEKQAAKEAFDKKHLRYFSFDEEQLFSKYASVGNRYIKGRNGSIEYEGDKPEEVYSDTPNGKGKSLLLGKKTGLTFSAVTFSVWIKDEGRGNACYFTDNWKIYRYPTSSTKQVAQLSVNKSQFIYKDNESSVVISENSPFQDKQWHLLTVVDDNEKQESRYYLDGKLAKTKPYRKLNISVPSDAKVTSFSQIGGKGNAIKIDNLRYYDIVLTDEEIAKIYEEEKGK